MPRVLWKGAISFGLVHIPVGLYSAEKRNNFDLTMLDRRNMKPVGFKRYNKETGEDVPWDQIVKGYEYEKERYVVLTDEDFRRANVEATQTIDILRFVEGKEITPMYFETPYYLAPDRRGEKGYALLRETLKHTHKVGIANVVVRTRQYVAALIPVGEVIVMNTLRYADEVRAADELDVPPKNLKAAGVTPRETDMAVKLVEEMTGGWNPEDYRDTYHEDLLKLIDKRIKAGETEIISTAEAQEAEEEPSRGNVVDLMALLKQSVQDKAKGRRFASTQSRAARSDRSRRKIA
ncbi:Ku protein [Nitrospira sp. BLG_2]|uniref:non-homologous end joining protein Ku n=1 Tax=Nitrospira sp. BLG_2 TaxID=3397507 RepID=UPI003B9A8434